MGWSSFYSIDMTNFLGCVCCNGWKGRYLMTGAVTLVASEKYGTNYICEETTKTKGIEITHIK